MAEQLGAVLALSVDDSVFNAGLSKALQQAETKGQQIEKALEARQSALSTNQSQIVRLQRDALGADESRAALIRQHISFIQQENREQQAGIAVLRQKLAAQNSITASLRQQETQQANQLRLSAQQVQLAKQQQIAAAGDTLSSALGALPGQMGTLSGVLASGPTAIAAALVGVSVAAVKVSDDFARMKQQLDLLTGSAEQTGAVLSQLKEYAAATPFDLPELADNAKLLMAFGFSARDAVEFVKRLGDVSTVTGTPLDRLALNLGQVVSLGKAYTVDLRQFAMAGVPIFETLSAVTGKTVAQLKAMDTIPADLVIKAFQRMTDAGGKFYEGGVKGGTAFSRETATLQDNLKAAGDAFGKLLTPTIVEALINTSKVVNLIAAALDRMKAAADALSKNRIVRLLLNIQNLVPSQGLFNLAGQGIDALSKATTDTKTKDVRKTGPSLIEKATDAARLKFAEDYGKEREKSIRSAESELRLAEAGLKLRGLALEQVKSEESILRARAAALQAQQKAAAEPMDGELKAKAEAAGLSLRAAIIDAGNQLRQAAEDASKRFVDAAQQLVNAKLKLSEVQANPQGLNRFLSPQDQQRQLQAAILRLGPDLEKALKDARAIFNKEGVGLGFDPFSQIRNIFDNAQTGRYIGQDSLQAVDQFIKDVDARRSAIRGVNDAQKTVNEINQELANVNGSLRDQVQALVAKDWGVQVNVSGGSASVYGDAVNRSLS